MAAIDKISRNGWSEDAKYVLISLEELKKQYSESENKIDDNRIAFMDAVNNLQLTFTKEIGGITSKIDVMENKITQKSTAIAALVGFLPAVGAVIWMLFKMKGLC